MTHQANPLALWLTNLSFQHFFADNQLSKISHGRHFASLRLRISHRCFCVRSPTNILPYAPILYRPIFNIMEVHQPPHTEFKSRLYHRTGTLLVFQRLAIYAQAASSPLLPSRNCVVNLSAYLSGVNSAKFGSSVFAGVDISRVYTGASCNVAARANKSIST